MKPTTIAVLAALLALPGCVDTPRLIGWSCGSLEQGSTVTVSSIRTLGPTGRPLSAFHSWHWQGPQGAVQLTIGQDASNRWDAAGEELVTISVGLEYEVGRKVRSVELRAGATGATTVLTARRSSRVLYGFQPTLATLRELAGSGEPFAVVLLDDRGQVVLSAALDIYAVGPAHDSLQRAMTRTLEMSRDYQNQCEARFYERPVVIT